MVCEKLVGLAVKRCCEEQKYCRKTLSALCQLWRLSLAWAGTIWKLGSSWEATKEESVRQCHFFSNFILKLFLVTQIFHPNLAIFFKRNKLRKCFVSTVGSSHDGLTSPHRTYNAIHLEDVWCHHACSIHPRPCFFALVICIIHSLQNILQRQKILFCENVLACVPLPNSFPNPAPPNLRKSKSIRRLTRSVVVTCSYWHMG